MSFYPQPNDWTCGPFALKHALIALGRMVPAEDIAAVAKSHWWSGTDELKLARAARAFDCELSHERTRDQEKARKMLTRALRSKHPVLLCVDDWGHWITALRQEGTRFVVVDSNLDPVLDALTWPQLRSRWRYRDYDYDEEDPPELFDLNPVIPRFRVSVQADFSLSRVRFLRRPENRNLAVYWNEYLEDLLDICRPRTSRTANPLSMAEFLRRHHELIESRVVYWHGDIDRELIQKLLRNLRFVAETYGLVIPEASSRQAITDLAILATMFAVARRGIGPIYGSGD